jgi:hypothetical protein
MLAKGLSRHESQINRWLSNDENQRKHMGEQLARDIEEKLGMPRLWLDEEHDGAPQKPGALVSVPAPKPTPRHGSRNVPVVGSLQTGLVIRYEEAEDQAAHFIEWASGDLKAFMVHVDTDDFAPRVRRCEFLCVEPSTPPAVGDQMLVGFKGEARLHILELRLWARDSYSFGKITCAAPDTDPVSTKTRAEVSMCYPITAVLIKAQLVQRLAGDWKL